MCNHLLDFTPLQYNYILIYDMYIRNSRTLGGSGGEPVAEENYDYHLRQRDVYQAPPALHQQHHAPPGNLFTMRLIQIQVNFTFC